LNEFSGSMRDIRKGAQRLLVMRRLHRWCQMIEVGRRKLCKAGVAVTGTSANLGG
jgi:hypothetical protein